MYTVAEQKELKFDESLRDLLEYKKGGSGKRVMARVHSSQFGTKVFARASCELRPKDLMSTSIVEIEREICKQERVEAIEYANEDILNKKHKKTALAFVAETILAVEFCVTQKDVVAQQVLVKWGQTDDLSWETYSHELAKHTKKDRPVFYSVLYEIIDRIMENKTGKIGNWTEIQGLVERLNYENMTLTVLDIVLDADELFQETLNRMRMAEVPDGAEGVPARSPKVSGFDVQKICEQVYGYETNVWEVACGADVVTLTPPAVYTEPVVRAESGTIDVEWTYNGAEYEPTACDLGEVEMSTRLPVPVFTFNKEFLGTLEHDEYGHVKLFFLFARRKLVVESSKHHATPRKNAAKRRRTPVHETVQRIKTEQRAAAAVAAASAEV